MLYDYSECSKNAVKIHFKCRSIFFYFECTSKVLNMRKTFRLVARMCPNVWNAHGTPSECLECTSIVQECTTNFDSNGIPAHSKSLGFMANLHVWQCHNIIVDTADYEMDRMFIIIQGDLLYIIWHIGSRSLSRQVNWAKLTWRAIAAVIPPGQSCTVCNKITMRLEACVRKTPWTKEVGTQIVKNVRSMQKISYACRLSRSIFSHFGTIHSWNVRCSHKVQNTKSFYFGAFEVIQGH